MSRLRWKKRLGNLPQAALDSYVLNLSQEKLLDWEQWTEGFNHIELEVGCGKGRFLIDAAMEHSDTLFIGIEPYHTLILYVLEQILDEKLENVSLLEGRIEAALAEFIPSNSLDAAHIYFPDPWPKARHAKRQVVSQEFLSDMAKALKTDAPLHLATDVKAYYDEMAQLLAAHPAYAIQDAWDLKSRPSKCFTHFDAKAREKGSNVYFIESQKQGQ